MKRKHRLIIWAVALVFPWISQLLPYLFPGKFDVIDFDIREVFYANIAVVLIGGYYEWSQRKKS